MAYAAPVVSYSSTIDGTYTALTGVQSVRVSRGRRFFQDNFSASSCVIDLIPAATYATPLAIGQFIDVRKANNSASEAYFTGRIIDIERSYDIPYNSTTGYAPGDRITITCGGAAGVVASNVIANTTYFGDLALQNVNAVLNDSGVQWVASNFGTVLSGNITVQNRGALDVVNDLLRTAQATMDDYDLSRVDIGRKFALIIYSAANATFVFEDTNPLTKFNRINYSSSAQSVFNKVNVEAAGLTAQTVSGTAPFNTLVYNTYNQTSTQALSLANYLYTIYSQSFTPIPSMIGTDSKMFPDCMQIAVMAPDQPAFIGANVSVSLRGVTTDTVGQGFDAFFYPDYGKIDMYLSPGFGTPFTLNSASFGVLNTNRLGYP
jgi:hypothetical protein